MGMEIINIWVAWTYSLNIQESKSVVKTQYSLSEVGSFLEAFFVTLWQFLQD